MDEKEMREVLAAWQYEPFKPVPSRVRNALLEIFSEYSNLIRTMVIAHDILAVHVNEEAPIRELFEFMEYLNLSYCTPPVRAELKFANEIGWYIELKYYHKDYKNWVDLIKGGWC